MPGIKIGTLASQAGCQVETIRYYEREGLLSEPVRTSGNYRLYGEESIERLRFIRQCRSLDMALDEIRVLLRFRDAPEQNCGDVNDLLDEHIEHVGRRIAELKSMEKYLRELRRQCVKTSASKDCAILNELAKKGNSRMPKASPAGHVGSSHAHQRK
jgi:Cd(II)/Pb(II)-responsive transcriptional regulator